MKASRFIARALTSMAEVLCAAWASGALFFDFTVWELFMRAAIFFVLVSEHLALTPGLMRLIDGRLWLVVARRRFGCGPPHPGPVMLDDDDLGVNDPGQHQR